MGSHISMLFKMANTLDGQNILSRARGQIIRGNTGVTTEACKQLENYLQGIFYGTQPQNQNIRSALEAGALSYLEKVHQQTFDGYDFEKNILSTSGETSGKIQLEEYASFSHSQRIGWTTVYQRWWNATLKLNELSKSSDPVAEFGDVYTQLQQLVATTSALLSQEQWISMSASGNKWFNVTDDSRGLINEIDRLYQAVTFVKGLPLNLRDTGEVFERALSAVGRGSAETNTDELIENFMQSTQGIQLAHRGGLISVKGLTVTSTEKFNKEKKDSSINYTVTGEEGSSYTIKGVFNAKQGKMDVLFTLPNGGQNFRVSAKNWSKIDSSHDFGETSLEAAILRTGGVNPALAYGLNLITDSPMQTVHQYAKACLVVDILMGYSQKENYADTVIINDRGSRQIRVFSIGRILNKINLDNDSILNYNGGNVSSTLSSKLDYSAKLGPQNYVGVILSTLATFKYRLSANVLKNY